MNKSTTQRLLLTGVVMTPLFFSVIIAQMVTREGFDITKHPISALSLGKLGWIQSVNFVVAGILALLLAIGLRRTLVSSKAGVWAPTLTGVFGVGIILAGLFATDPAFGFPLGTPNARPATMSSHAMLHSAGFYTAFTALIATCFVMARRYSAQKDTAWARFSIAIGIVTPILIILGMSALSSLAGLCFSVGAVLVMGWLSATAWRLRTQS
jgi:hypothetical protein